MDNMTGKETTVLIMIIIDSICMMIHISGYFTYPAMVRSHCSRISEGPLYYSPSRSLRTFSSQVCPILTRPKPCSQALEKSEGAPGTHCSHMHSSPGVSGELGNDCIHLHAARLYIIGLLYRVVTRNGGEYQERSCTQPSRIVGPW